MRCPTCNLLNPGPEHLGNQPLLCAERPHPIPYSVTVEAFGHVSTRRIEALSPEAARAEALERIGFKIDVEEVT